MKQNARTEIEAQLRDEREPAPHQVPCEGWYGHCDHLIPVGASQFCTSCEYHRKRDLEEETRLYRDMENFDRVDYEPVEHDYDFSIEDDYDYATDMY